MFLTLINPAKDKLEDIRQRKRANLPVIQCFIYVKKEVIDIEETNISKYSLFYYFV